jgi:hypothetical protein
MGMERTVDAIVDDLKHGHAFGRKCTLLIGAGCSVAGGIPTAAGFVEIIKEKFKSAYEAADIKTYARCMAQLHRGVQRELIAEKVDAARINWAHMAIAQLMKAGYVDRVLTTNFDPLVVRGCAMVGEYPAVYDFAASQLFKPDHVPDKAVFHLHGQRDGFVLMNTEKECEEHAKRLGPLFADAGRGRSWIVVGYSGDNDPVFQHLADVAGFDFGLYWIGYKDSEPADHVRGRLLAGNKGAFYVRGFDADRFFVELAQRLECFPPDLVERPFSHLARMLGNLVSFPLPIGEKDIDFLAKPRDLIKQAVHTFEAPTTYVGSDRSVSVDVKDLTATALFMAGKYRDVEALVQGQEPKSPLLTEVTAWSHVAQGASLIEQARTKVGDEADRLFQLAAEKFQAALAIKPDMHEALKTGAPRLRSRPNEKPATRPIASSSLPPRNSRLHSPSSPTSTRPSATGATHSRARPGSRAAMRPVACSPRRARSTRPRSRSSRTSTKPSTIGPSHLCNRLE